MKLTHRIASERTDSELAEVMRAQSDEDLALFFRNLTPENQANMLASALLHEINSERANPPAPPAPPKPRKPRSTNAARDALDAAVLARFSPGATRATSELTREVGANAQPSCVRLVKAGRLVRVGLLWRMPDAKAPLEPRVSRIVSLADHLGDAKDGES